MKKSEDLVLRALIERIVSIYSPERIYLFGSRAREASGPDSDYDLLVVMPDGSPAELLRSRLAYQALWDIGTAADILIWPKKAFDDRRNLAASLPGTVLREGRLVHGKE